MGCLVSITLRHNMHVLMPITLHAIALLLRLHVMVMFKNNACMLHHRCHLYVAQDCCSSPVHRTIMMQVPYWGFV